MYLLLLAATMAGGSPEIMQTFDNLVDCQIEAIRRAEAGKYPYCEAAE